MREKVNQIETHVMDIWREVSPGEKRDNRLISDHMRRISLLIQKMKAVAASIEATAAKSRSMDLDSDGGNQ